MARLKRSVAPAMSRRESFCCARSYSRRALTGTASCFAETRWTLTQLHGVLRFKTPSATTRASLAQFVPYAVVFSPRLYTERLHNPASRPDTARVDGLVTGQLPSSVYCPHELKHLTAYRRPRLKRQSESALQATHVSGVPGRQGTRANREMSRVQFERGRGHRGSSPRSSRVLSAPCGSL